MQFEIFDNQDNRVFYTEYVECIPSLNDLKTMQRSSGYKFRYNGRKTSLKALQEVFNSSITKQSI